MKTLKSVWVAAVLLLLFSCKQEIIIKEVVQPISKSSQVINTYVIDWESSGDYLPTNPPNIVPFPWKGQAGTSNSNLLYDYKKSDGWVLVYNTFNPTASPYFATMPPGGLYFALYNRFRGLLRFYLYIPPGWTYPSSYIQHGLKLSTNVSATTSMLNFESGEVVDVSVNQPSITQTNNQQLQAFGGWSIMQYEIAYDPNIGASANSYPGLGLNWWAKTFTITEVQLSGTLAGSITGTITQPATSWDINSTIATFPKAIYSVFGASDLGGFLVNAAGDSPGKKYKDNVSTALQNLISGNINGFFSGLLGGNSGSSQTVDLQINCDLKMSGTLTNSAGITNPILTFPGQVNAQTNPDQWIPFNEPMGVFNLTAKPKITYNLLGIMNSSCNACTPPKEIITEKYTLVPSSYQIVYNPKVLQSATISNVRTQIVAIKNGNGSFGTLENIGTKTVYSGVSPVTTPWYTRGFNNNVRGGWATWGVRIAMDVTPNNGAPKVTIVKTFAATVQ